jgi:hypothetical protein
MSRVLQDIPVMFQWLPLTCGGSVRHACDMVGGSNKRPLQPLRFYDDTGREWARLGPVRRAAFNRLRQERNLQPFREPAVDLSPKPYVPTPCLLDPSPLARAVLGSRDPEEREALRQQLSIVTESLLTARDGDPSMLASRLRGGVATPEECRFAADLLEGRIERPAHRRPTLDRELREHAARILLRAWYFSDPRQRVRWKTTRAAIDGVRRGIYGISRSEAFELLKQIKAETVEHAELVDGTVVEPATAVRALAGLLIRRGQDRQRSRRLRKAK